MRLLESEAELVSDEHRFWYAILSLFFAVVLAGLGMVFLSYGFSAENEVASVLAFMAAVVADLNALAFLFHGSYQLLKATVYS